MLIYVYGEDSFRVQEKTAELVSAFQKKFDTTGLNVDRLDGEKISAEELSNAVRTQPFLATRRMIVVRGLLGRKGGKQLDSYGDALHGHSDQVIVVLSDTVSVAAAEKHVIRKAGGKDAVVYSFATLSGKPLEAWIQARMTQAGGQISDDAVHCLAELVGSDLWRMSQEVDKLVAYCLGRAITPSDVELLVDRHIEENVFALTDALSTRKFHEAARLLKDELASGSDAFGIFALFTRQIRLLTQARSFLDSHPQSRAGELAEALGVHPFVGQKLFAQARGFSAHHLQDMHDGVVAVDRNVKTGRSSMEQGIIDLLAIAAQ